MSLSACSTQALLADPVTTTAPAPDAQSDTFVPVEPAPVDRVLIPAAAPLPPGTALDISAETPTPGTYFNFQICTAAYSFTLEDGRSYAVTASHCGKEGETVWAGQESGSFRYPADPIGTVVYSDFYNEDPGTLDVAFIELTGAADYYTPEPVATVVADRLEALPAEVCKLGRITGRTCGPVTHHPQLGKLNADGVQLDSASARAMVCGTTGDSGGPVLGTVGGREAVVGLVSGTTRHLLDGESCSAVGDIEMSFTPVIEIQRLAARVLGAQAGELQEITHG